MKNALISTILLLLGAWAVADSPTAYIAHEWGTFTSVQGSNGISLQGLQHEDEPLPDFVYGRDGLPKNATVAKQGAARPHVADDGHGSGGSSGGSSGGHHPCPGCHGKRMEVALLANTGTAVTQKLETPVIYFHAKNPVHVAINVNFPGGILSQWYPNASHFSPNIGQVSALKNGSLSWSINVLDHAVSIPKVSPQDIWAPSRDVQANYVSVHGENEKFIFYRGLGKFEVPFRVRSHHTNLSLENYGDLTIPSAFLIRVEKNQGVVVPLHALAASSQTAFELQTLPALLPMDTYLKNVSAQLTAALVQSGLYEDESRAMVATWSKSYFHTPGTRILYVLPRAWTDRILPLTLTPAPTQLVRTMVGRVEILSESEETALATRVAQSAEGKMSDQALVNSLGRFAEPKLRRVSEVTFQITTQNRARSLLRVVE